MKGKMSRMRGLDFSCSTENVRNSLVIVKLMFSYLGQEDKKETNISRKTTHKEEKEDRQDPFEVRKCA